MTAIKCRLYWRIALLALGICFIGTGCYLYKNWIEMFTRIRGKEMALSPTSPSYEGWKISPLPLNFDVYLFNWTNPEDFYIGSKKKPRFEQLGPYRFREKSDKVDIDWHAYNYTVSFRKKAYFYFDAEHSNGTLNDKITTVNTVAHSAALRSRDLNFFAKFSIRSGLILYSQSLTESKTAGEWIFDGYKHPLVTVGRFLSPGDVPYDRVGWLYTRNGSSTFEGYFNMYTGANDIYKMGQVHTWNGLKHTGAFDGICGNVIGSMGEFFPPNLSINDTISLFLPNLCRAIPLDYTETVAIHGLTVYRFSGGARAVDNGTQYPETKCFCVDGKCEAAGVINIARCKYNSSIYMSYPHFYLADPSYLAAIEGLKPEKEKHEFFITLEPNAGLPVDVGGGFQANYLIEPIEDMPPFENIPRTFIPIMWCEERVRVTPDIAANIALVPFIVLLGQVITGALLAIGLICVCWYPTRLATRLCNDDDPKVKATLLRPLNRSMPSTGTQTRSIIHKPGDSVFLVDFRRANAAEVDASVTKSLLGKSLRPPNDAIIR